MMIQLIQLIDQLIAQRLAYKKNRSSLEKKTLEKHEKSVTLIVDFQRAQSVECCLICLLPESCCTIPKQEISRIS